MSEQQSLRNRHRRREGRALQVLRRYRFELILLIAVAVGLFLLLERTSLRASLAVGLRDLVNRLFSRFQELDSELTAFLVRVSVSEIIGGLLISGAAVAILLRIRWRLLNDPRLTAATCPKCRGSIYRAHRTAFDRLVSVFVPVRRYRCRNADCGWRGLRVGSHHASVERRAPSRS